MISYDDLYDKLYDNVFALKKAGGWRGLKECNIVAVRTLQDGTWFVRSFRMREIGGFAYMLMMLSRG